MHHHITGVGPPPLFYSFGSIISSKFATYIVFRLASERNPPRMIERLPAYILGEGRSPPHLNDLPLWAFSCQ